MKKIIILILAFILFSSHSLWDGDMDNFTKIEVYQGYSIYGSKSIKLSENGLICRNHEYYNKRNKGIIFIPYRKLNFDKMISLQSFLLKNKQFVGYGSVLKTITSNSSPDVFVFRYNNYENTKMIKDFLRKDIKLDSVKVLLNNLLPKRYKKKYSLQVGNVPN